MFPQKRNHEIDQKAYEEGRMLSAMTDDDVFVAYFIRRVQIHWMIHRCSPNYCTRNCCPCRFFYPYTKEQYTQEQNDEVERMAHIRRWLADDARVATHVLEILLATGTHVQNILFYPIKGGRMAGIYAVKYCGKPEKITMLETVHAEDTEVIEYLKTRTRRACMAYYRHNGGKIAEMHHDVMFFLLCV